MALVAQDAPKILILAGTEERSSSLLSLLNEHGQVRLVGAGQEAVEAIQSGEVDYVLSEAPDFLPNHCEQCSRWVRHSLATSGEGVAAVGLDGRILWGNAVIQTMPEDVIGAVVATCLGVVGRWRIPEHSTDETSRIVERLAITEDDGHLAEYEVAISPVLNTDGDLLQLAAVVRNVTAAAEFQRRMRPVEQAGQQLMRFDAEQLGGLSVPERLARIEEQIAAYAHSLMNFQRFSIRILDPQTNRLDIALAQGMADEVHHRDIRAEADDNGICGWVACNGRSYICPDTSQDPRYLRGIGDSGSSLTVPLWLHKDLVGVFNVESDQLNAFDDVDRQLLEVFGRHVAMALKVLDLLVVERSHTTDRFADDVSSEIAGPLNDIVSDTAALQSEYIGDEALTGRLQAISQNATRIRETIKEVARPRNGVRGRVRSKPIDSLLLNRRVLVADDEDAIRETLYEVLRKQGCEVDTARDGMQATSLLSRNRYDLVLADIRMPHKNGYEVFAAAKDSNDETAVILITGFGYDPNHSIVRARQEGLSAVLFKPFKVDQLLEEVRQALTQPVGGSAE